MQVMSMLMLRFDDVDNEEGRWGMFVKRLLKVSGINLLVC